VANLFERLDKGRPPPIEEPIKQSRKNADLIPLPHQSDLTM